MAKNNNKEVAQSDVMLITKTDLKNHFEAFSQKNPEFYSCVKSIYQNLPQSERYVYHVSLPYGRQLIHKSEFVALNSKKSHDIEIVNDFSEQPLTHLDLLKDFGKDIDFPLSIIIKNYIEIYSERTLDTSNSEFFKFPLDHIKQGELFGVWGSLNSLKQHELKQVSSYKKINQNWHGVAGRECFVSFFKEYPTSIARVNPKDQIFEAIFNTQEHLPQEKAIQKFIRENVQDSNVEILCFPKFYFLPSNETTENENPLEIAKKNLVSHLLKKEWFDNNTERQIFWNNVHIKNNLTQTIPDFINSIDVQITNHIINIIQGNHFHLKNICKNDAIEYRAFELMVEKLKNNDFGKRNSVVSRFKDTLITKAPSETKKVESIFEFFTPYFMYFSKDWDTESIGVTFIKTPPIMDLFFYNKDKNKAKNDTSTRFNQINGFINDYISENLSQEERKPIKYKFLIDMKDIEDFINTKIGNNNMVLINDNSFQPIKDVINTSPRFREYFSVNKANIPEIFKQYAFIIYHQ